MPSQLPEGVVQLNVRLPEELREELRREAFNSHRSINDIAIDAITLYLAALTRQRKRTLDTVLAGG